MAPHVWPGKWLCSGQDAVAFCSTHRLPDASGRLRADAWVGHVAWGRARVLYPGRADAGEASLGREGAGGRGLAMGHMWNG